MTALLATVTSAGFATVQDGGRPGFTHVGVPLSGAFHRERHLVSSGLLGGALGARRPAIELLSGALVLTASTDLLLAVVGPARCEIDERRAAVGAVVIVTQGSVVRVSVNGRGPVYVAVDGWEPELVLGSAATDTFSGLGGSLLRPGDRLMGSVTVANRAERVGAFHRPLPLPSGAVRIVGTGHPALRSFAAGTWSVTAASRSGVRLAGGPIAASGSVASAPLLPGAIQLTPGGEPIVIGPDGGLTGGYPVVAVVASADLDRLSLLNPGDGVGFRVVDVVEAAAARREQLRLTRASIAHPDHLP